MCVEKPKDGNISLFLNQKPSFLGELFGFFLDEGFGISFFLFRFSSLKICTSSGEGRVEGSSDGGAAQSRCGGRCGDRN